MSTIAGCGEGPAVDPIPATARDQGAARDLVGVDATVVAPQDGGWRPDAPRPLDASSVADGSSADVRSADGRPRLDRGSRDLTPSPDARVDCPETTVRCDGRCVDPLSDPNNCGGCGTRCGGGTTCQGGSCRCPAGWLVCDGQCVDGQTDARHCGACGKKCDYGQVCDGGTCQCPPGKTPCTSNGRQTCVDLTEDRYNCGACGKRCASDTVCREGQCQGCLAPTVLCSPSMNRCANLATDATHCGSCYNSCGSGGSCINGSCTCSGSVCNGFCVDTETNAQHCGGCNHACSSGACANGTCLAVAPCPTGLDRCDGACVNLQTFLSHCGACGNRCADGQQCYRGQCVDTCPGTSCTSYFCADLQRDVQHCGACDNDCKRIGGSECVAGQCGCTGGRIVCGAGYYGQRCVDPSTDPRNCGGCGIACGPGERCEQGKCRCAPGAVCPGNCRGQCQSGQLCASSECVDSCPGGATPCDDSCVDLASDPAHCGACGTRCTAGTVCVQGQCICPPGQDLCQGACVDLTSDGDHCGACNNTCNGGICSAGSCSCPGYLIACNGSCVVPRTDDHCGGCNRKCPAGSQCKGSYFSVQCVPSGCPDGQRECIDYGDPEDPDAMPTPICVDTRTDPKHCGGCGFENNCYDMDCYPGYPCYCIDGQCHANCPEGFTTCTGGLGGQVCVDLQRDRDHCGTCNTACGPGLGCYQGSCQSCPAGTVDCDGACVELASDPHHCGACGNVCQGGSTCQQGQCRCGESEAWACGSGEAGRCVDFGDETSCGLCNASCQGGTSCEGGQCRCLPPRVLCAGRCVDLQTDRYRCGGCDNVCPAGQSCVQGHCE